MMILLTTAVRLLLPVLLLFSLILLFRGHDHPGGGFVAGLVAVLALALHALAFGTQKTRGILRISPRLLLAMGLGTAVLSGLIGPAAGHLFLSPVWTKVKLAALGQMGTPVLFDIGVYLTVTGGILLILFSLMEEG